jgi:ketosteroid isomerase-like protein
MRTSAEVTAGLQAFYEAFNTHDVARVEERMAHGDGVSVIGSAPGEGHDDRAGWLHAYETGIAAAGFTLEGGDAPKGFADDEGDAGYATDTPSFVMPDGSRLPTRLTAVLVNEAGEWKVAHMHFSVGVPDEDAVQPAP